MALCDVCARPSARHVIESQDFQQAVDDGYNPFSMGLTGPTLEQLATMAQISGTDPYSLWRRQLSDRGTGDWLVCDGCLPALRPFLGGNAVSPTANTAAGPSACSKCGGTNPASQWHCTHCGHIQWGLIVFSIITGVGMAFWALSIANWLGRGIVGILAVLFLWIGVSSIRDGIRARRYL